MITAARSGRIDRTGGDQFVVLSDGQRTELETTTGQIKVMEFAEYSVLANAKALGQANQQPAKSLATSTLIRQPTLLNLAELSWRVGMALSAFNLMLLAILFSAVNPRAGRGFGIALALLAFVTYYNLQNLGYSRIASGQTSFATWMLSLHGGVLAFTLLWMTARHNQWSWRNLLPTRATSIKAA